MRIYKTFRECLFFSIYIVLYFLSIVNRITTQFTSQVMSYRKDHCLFDCYIPREGQGRRLFYLLLKICVTVSIKFLHFFIIIIIITTRHYYCHLVKDNNNSFTFLRANRISSYINKTICLVFFYSE